MELKWCHDAPTKKLVGQAQLQLKTRIHMVRKDIYSLSSMYLFTIVQVDYYVILHYSDLPTAALSSRAKPRKTITMSNLGAYCPPVNSGASAPPLSKKRDLTSGASYNNNDETENNEDNEEEEEQTELKRRCIDYHTPAVIDLTSRLYRKSNRRSHALPGGSGLAYPYLQCHTNYVSLYIVYVYCIMRFFLCNVYQKIS